MDYMVGKFRGSVSNVEGSLEVDSDGNGTLRGQVAAKSVEVQDENMSAHLLSPEFFDVARTPQITFVSTELVRDNDDVVAHGELTIKVTTKSVVLRGKFHDLLIDAFEQSRVGLALSGTIDRTEFGLDWNTELSTGEPALANDVELSAELYFVKA